jgi:hypothetical protein
MQTKMVVAATVPSSADLSGGVVDVTRVDSSAVP